MLYPNPLPCISCNTLPALKTKSVVANSPVVVYYYECEKCDISTFGTREEICARELWNAAIERKRNAK